MKNFPKFYQIIDDVSWLPRLLPVGVKLVQLRIKDKPIDNVRHQIIEAKALCEQAGCQLVVNDYWQLVIELGCDYLHLGQEDLAEADIEQIKSAGVRLGISTHSHEELDVALSVNPDYIALGPVYETTLKKMPWQPQGLDRVREWKQKINDVDESIPLIGIGGLTIERAEGVYKAGADCISVVSDVLMNDNPESRLKQWLEIAQ